MLTNVNQQFALRLLKIGAIRFGAFRLKLHEKNPAAPLSPIYVDLRVLRSFPDDMDQAVVVYSELMKGLEFDCYADVPTAATPIVAVLSHATRIPMITPRVESKEHGMKFRIDGVYGKNQVAVLIDDIVTKADSKLEAIHVLEANGIRVHDVVVLVDREQGGEAELARHGYKCHSSVRLSELLEFYSSSHLISSEEYSRTKTYLESSGER